jgi:hypothetical protein
MAVQGGGLVVGFWQWSDVFEGEREEMGNSTVGCVEDWGLFGAAGFVLCCLGGGGGRHLCIAISLPGDAPGMIRKRTGTLFQLLGMDRKTILLQRP